MDLPSFKPTVLIADDEPMVRSRIRTALSNLECSALEEVADGESAGLKCAKLRPDITVLDIDMPGKDGLDTLQELLVINPDALAVIVSGHSTFENVQLAIDRGASGFIVKPFTISKIEMAVEKFPQRRCRDVTRRQLHASSSRPAPGMQSGLYLQCERIDWGQRS